MKYTIEEYVFNDYNASSKARKDVSHFILKNGFHSLFKNDKTKIQHNKLAKILLSVKLYINLLRLKQNDTLFVQTSLMVLKPILKIKSIKKFKLIYLIHDLFCLRYNSEESIKEHSQEIKRSMSVISQCDYVIAHNDIMVQRLRDFGCTSLLIPLEIFDYYCNFPPKRRKLIDGERVKVTFAGYLGKSHFLKQLDESQHKYQLIVYGLPEIELKNSIYKGSVDADVLPNVIEGHFGLIWEGDYDVQEQDNYTCINNPHKLSMYIVAGLPVIAWEKSAAGKFIEKNKIGFCIKSLNEIDDIIVKVTSNDYATMVENCINLRDKLIAGMFFKKALEKLQI